MARAQAAAVPAQRVAHGAFEAWTDLLHRVGVPVRGRSVLTQAVVFFFLILPFVTYFLFWSECIRQLVDIVRSQPEPTALVSHTTITADCCGSTTAPQPDQLYNEFDAGLVEEVCILISSIGNLEGKTPSSVNLFDFIKSHDYQLNNDKIIVQLCHSCSRADVLNGVEVENLNVAQGYSERLRLLNRVAAFLDSASRREFYYGHFLHAAQTETFQEKLARYGRICRGSWV